MTTFRRLIVAALLAALALGLAPALAGASPQTDLAKTRAAIAAAHRQKDTLGEQIKALDTKVTSLDAQLSRIGDQIDGLQQKLTATREKLEALREQVRLKRLELAAAQKKLDLEQGYFARRVVVMYKTSDLTYLDVMLSSTSFEDLIGRLRVVHDLIGGDDQLVATLAGLRDQVKSQTDAVAEQETGVQKAVADLEQQSRQLVALRVAQTAEQAQALAARQQKSGAMATVNDNLALLERQQNELLAESGALAGVINGAAGSGHGTGSMMWPVNGPVTSRFGWRTNPISGTREFHTGIDIGVGYGTPIHAADGGTVIYATWMSGYGNVTIIDHGRGISTLYGHQSSIAVSGGSRVSRGQVIGYVGSTGFSTGPHLHFEVRVGGNPVDPMGYLP